MSNSQEEIKGQYNFTQKLFKNPCLQKIQMKTILDILFWQLSWHSLNDKESWASLLRIRASSYIAVGSEIVVYFWGSFL